MKYLLIISLLMLSSCTEGVKSQEKTSPKESQENSAKNSYWYDGTAEISTFELRQNRYNTLHPGKLVMVFVTEDFLTEKQVKNETYTDPKSTKVLKNIRLRTFTTGIYDYSLHTSVFTPIDRGIYKTLKVTNSMQEWCGTTFRQLNATKSGFGLTVRSYFEQEGDQELKLNNAILEDEFMNLLRMNPSFLPTGEFEMIAGLSYLSLKHKEPKLETVIAVLQKYTGSNFVGENLMEYMYQIASQSRMVRIVFKPSELHEIIGITESYPSAFDGKLRTSIATLKTIKKLPYWQLNSPKDAQLREGLGIGE